MGGMVLLEMAAQQPERFRAIVPIAVSDAHSAWRIAFSSVIRKTIIAHDPSLSDSQKLVEGMKLARQIATTTYRCSDEFDSRFGREQIGTKFEVENYLEHQGEKIADHFSPYSYLTLTRAMELYVLCQCGISFSFCQAERSNMAEAKAYATPPCPVHSRLIQCPALFIGISSDILYSSREIESFAALFPQGEYRTLVAGHGHDSFLVDAEALAKLVQPFFLSAEINHSQLQSVL